MIKLGHQDDRFTDGMLNGDGEPAVGRLENLRVSDDGQQLLADLAGLPAWLDEIIESAYPSRSIEALLDVEMGDGRTYAMVVTGLALLGVTAPAIESLGDIADLFGVSRDVADYVTAARARVAASALPEGEQMPQRPPTRAVTASASIDELSQAAEDWAMTQPMLGSDCWVRDIYTDTVIFTCWRGDDCMYCRVPWTESNGAFTFGAPEMVRPTYEPVPAPATMQGGTGDAMAAGSLPIVTSQMVRRVLAGRSPGAVPSARGRGVTAASDHSRETHVPISPALAAALGVPEDADDEAALAALDKLRTPAAPPPGEQTTQEGGATSTTTPDVEQLVTAAVARATQPILASLETTSTELAAMKAERATAVRAGVIGEAITAGKIKPADRATWEADYDASPGVVTSILAKLAPGTAVPVTAAGRTGGEELGSDDALYAQLYGSAEKAGA